MQNYFEILGISIDATPEEIKKAYRKLAKKWHPDMHPPESQANAEIQFKRVVDAFENLQKNQPHNNKKTKPAPKKPEPQPHNPQPKDIECSYFGGYPDGSGKSVLIQLWLSSQEMQAGGHKIVLVKKRAECMACMGSRERDIVCPTCKGRQRINYNGFAYHCERCQGEGVWREKCTICAGVGLNQWKVEEVRVMIPPNSKSGEQVIVQGAGEDSYQRNPGNLRVVLLEKS